MNWKIWKPQRQKNSSTHTGSTLFCIYIFPRQTSPFGTRKKRDIVSCQVSTAGGAAVMPAAARPAVVSLSVGRTPPQTRAGDAHGRHPLASAADCVRVCVYACVRVCA